ncbi:MAG: cytochrome c [Gemmatimonadetes bacterium]|nr:cytochrome c [Gemmatimonadota bacterium]
MRRLLAVSLAALSLAACRSAARGGSNGGGGAAAKVTLPAEVTPANVALGDSLFNNGGCMRCHGAKGVGAQNGPVLADDKWDQLTTGSYEEIRAIIVSGVPKEKIKVTTRPNPMGARGGRMNLTDAQITAVAAYVYTLSHPAGK